jgi:hypothetical protein
MYVEKLMDVLYPDSVNNMCSIYFSGTSLMGIILDCQILLYPFLNFRKLGGIHAILTDCTSF